MSTTLMNGISALIKKNQRASSFLDVCGHSEKMSIFEEIGPPRHQICQCLDLGLPSIQYCEKEIYIV